MINDYLTIALSFVMGLAIFVSAPLIFHKRTSLRRMMFYNAIAIGILVFLLMDIYGDVAAVFGSARITSPMELIFLAGFVLAFLFFIIPTGSRDPEANPKRTSLLAAVGIGFQNLTEGLVFGSAGAAGLASIYLLSLIGFTLQNVTEGFPIAAPLIGLKNKLKKKFVAGAFLLGGLPTVIGTLIGLVFFSSTFIIFFDALASAAILYVVLVLFHVNVNRARSDDRKSTSSGMWLTYAGILVGFAIAFVVNYI
jgi:ZIP family zinc transporter